MGPSTIVVIGECVRTSLIRARLFFSRAWAFPTEIWYLRMAVPAVIECSIVQSNDQNGGIIYVSSPRRYNRLWAALPIPN